MVFEAEYGSVKESIAYMNERKESGRINQGEYEEFLCQEWILMVQTFTDLLGKNMVNNDLRVVLNSLTGNGYEPLFDELH